MPQDPPASASEGRGENSLSDAWAEEITDLLMNAIERRQKNSDEARQRATKEIVQRVQPLLAQAASQQISREDLHRLLDACLDLKDLADHHRGLPGTPVDQDPHEAGRHLSQALLVGAAGWVERLGDSIAEEAYQLSKRDTLSHRESLALSLLRIPGLLRSDDRRLLADSLMALNDGTGEVPPFFQPYRESGQGQDPILARDMEEAVWWWISWRQNQQGHEVNQQDALNEVHNTRGGWAPDAVKKWREKAQKRRGKEEFNTALEYYRILGREGKPFGPPGFTLEKILSERERGITPPEGSSTKGSLRKRRSARTTKPK